MGSIETLLVERHQDNRRFPVVKESIIRWWRSLRCAALGRLSGLFVMGCCSLWVTTGITAAQNIAAQTIDEDLSQLSQGDYAARHQATLKMWKNRDQTRSAVQRAARNEDPEIAGRANWILRQWRRGALPQTPPEISRLLGNSDSQSAILQLIENGQFEAAVVAVEESAGTPMRETISGRISAAVLQRFPVYAHLAFENQSIPALLQLVDLVAETPEMSLCRIRLMQYLDIPIDDQSLLPKSSSAWSPIQQQQTRVVLLSSLGQYESAMELANQSDNPDLIRRCQMIAGDWQGLKKNAYQSAIQLENDVDAPSKISTWSHWSDVLVAASRSHDTKAANEAISRLTPSEDELQELSQAGSGEQADQAWQRPWNTRWRALAMHGHVEPAMEIFSKLDPAGVANLWLTVSRPSQAFQSLGFQISQVDANLHLWIDEAIEKQRAQSEPAVEPETRKLMSLMQALLLAGREDSAWLIASRLSGGNLGDSYLGIGKELVTGEVLDILSNSGRTDWAFDLAMQMDDDLQTKEGEQAITASRLAAIAGALPETSEDTLEVVLEALHWMWPKSTLTQRVKAAGELLRGRLPKDFDAENDVRRLYEFVIRPRPTRAIAERLARSATLRANMQIVWMFSRLDQPDFASTTLRKLAESGDPEAILEIANRALDSGDLDSAETIFRTIHESASLGGFRNKLLSGNNAHRIASYPSLAITGKALVGQWIVARSRSDEVSANALKQEIKVLLCGPSNALQRSVAAFLSKRGEKEWAAEIYQAILAATWFEPEESIEFYQDARRFALLASETNAASSARWFDLAMIQIMDSDQFLPTAFVTLPVYVHRWSLEAAIEQGDVVEAQYRVKQALDLDPLDLDLSERLLPPMRDSGMTDLADQTLLQVIEYCEAHAKQFPGDAITLNNVAWVAAVNRQHFDRALVLSRQAVRVEPDSAIYRDTLAEILFLMNQKDQAIQIEQDCVIDDPGQWHLHQQIQRFSQQP
jgi:hypothetical protein